MKNTTEATMTTETVRLNNGVVVFAKRDARGLEALKFVNLTQANAAAVRLGGTVVGRWPFFVAVPEAK